MENTDFLTELGFLGFVTRLKRLSDMMLHDGRRLYKELGMEIEPNWYVVFKLLQKHEQLTVTEIADKIGFAHPSVITIVNKMINAGYLESDQCSEDSRRRLLRLSDKAEKEMPEFERIWSAGIATMKNMLNDIDALNFLGVLESRTNEKGFKERTLEGLKKESQVTIFEYEGSYAEDFARLNYEWVEEYFEVEEPDRRVLDNPETYVIKPGGQIFFAKIGDDVVGTVALINFENDAFELAKMAVTTKYRGFSIGKKLMDRCIAYAKKSGKKRLFLDSNRKLVPAISLYKKSGFKAIRFDEKTPYARSDIRMELIL